MASITILENRAGKFKIKFSIKTGNFEIEPPDNFYPTNKNIRINQTLKTWDSVKEELKNIERQFLCQKKFVKKVIVITLRTSESKYKRIKETPLARNPYDDDFLSKGTGFILNWFVANEYYFDTYPEKQRTQYEIIEANTPDGYYKGINIKQQIFFFGDGELRMYDYSEKLYNFLKSIDMEISEMLKKMINYFDKDNTKFLNNVIQSKFKMLNSGNKSNENNRNKSN